MATTAQAAVTVTVTFRGLAPGQLTALTLTTPAATPLARATADGSQVTETVYLQQIRPVLLGGAEAMDRIFTAPDGQV